MTPLAKYELDKASAEANGGSRSMQRVVRSDFPRIVTNGHWYRVETAPGKYTMRCGEMGATWTWETRFHWRARMELRSAAKEEAEDRAREPDRWKPVASNGADERPAPARENVNGEA